MLSIIIVSYNSGDDFNKTIRSIISQEFNDYEIILIDGNSDDIKTLDYYKEFKNSIDQFISENDTGIYDAMNKGIGLSQGDHLFFLNCGDVFTSNTILKEVYSRNVDFDIIYGDIQLLDQNEVFLGYQKAKKFNQINLLVFGTRTVCHQAIFVRRTLATNYNLKYRFKGELNWYFDIIRKKPSCTRVNIPVSKYKLGGFGYTNYRANQMEKIQLIKERFNIFALLLSMPVIIYGFINFNIRKRKDSYGN